MATQRPAHHHPGGGFLNPWPSAARSVSAGAGLKMFGLFFGPVVAPPRVPPQVPAAPPASGATLTWIGHATFLVQLSGAGGGCTVLTDPIFSERCSPVQWAGPKRFSAPALRPAELPPLDAVVLSHNHYDHLDAGSVRELLDVHWFVPLGVGAWLRECGVAQVTELDWWDAAELPNGATVTCTPCQHFSGRSLTDRNATLWASWAVATDSARVWFGGDTGYRAVPGDETTREEREALPHCPAFAEIGRRLGPFTAAMIPIGAFCPRNIMSAVHADPVDAVDIHVDVRARRSVGMHFGAFKLTIEPTDAPPKRLAEEVARRGMPPEEFSVMAVGETRHFPSEVAGGGGGGR